MNYRFRRFEKRNPPGRDSLSKSRNKGDLPSFGVIALV